LGEKKKTVNRRKTRDLAAGLEISSKAADIWVQMDKISCRMTEITTYGTQTQTRSKVHTLSTHTHTHTHTPHHSRGYSQPGTITTGNNKTTPAASAPNRD